MCSFFQGMSHAHGGRPHVEYLACGFLFRAPRILVKTGFHPTGARFCPSGLETGHSSVWVSFEGFLWGVGVWGLRGCAESVLQMRSLRKRPVPPKEGRCNMDPRCPRSFWFFGGGRSAVLGGWGGWVGWVGGVKGGKVGSLERTSTSSSPSRWANAPRALRGREPDQCPPGATETRLAKERAWKIRSGKAREEGWGRSQPEKNVRIRMIFLFMGFE